MGSRCCNRKLSQCLANPLSSLTIRQATCLSLEKHGVAGVPAEPAMGGSPRPSQPRLPSTRMRLKVQPPTPSAPRALLFTSRRSSGATAIYGVLGASQQLLPPSKGLWHTSWSSCPPLSGGYQQCSVYVSTAEEPAAREDVVVAAVSLFPCLSPRV